jgi:hypothetical protein
MACKNVGFPEAEGALETSPSVPFSLLLASCWFLAWFTLQP